MLCRSFDTLGENINQVFGYEDDSGLLNSIGGDKQSQSFSYDGMGNLHSRTNNLQLVTDPFTLNQNALNEVFTYDDLNRMETVTLNNGMPQSVTYADNGNILTKHDVQSGATYNYGTEATHCDRAAGPHALTSVDNLSYCYDANGNQTKAYDGSTLTRDIGYTAFDKPSSIVSGGETTAFTYGVDRARYKRVHTDSNSRQTQSYYFGNIEFVQNHNSSSSTPVYDIKRYVGNYGLQTFYANGTVQAQYLLKDHIGSIDVVTNALGGIENMMSFDAWGNRRGHFNWAVTSGSVASLTAITKRGFTGHEHIDHAKIIHMNGRIYDPHTGRFIQADPHIQAPKASQSFNRYSYVLNNPLSMTDPTGYFFQSLKKYWRVIAAIVITINMPAALPEAWSTATVGAVTGAVAGAVSTGTLKGAFIGAFTGAMFGELHNMAAGIGKVAAHGTVGGISSFLGGGKFGHGFLSAGFTQALSQMGNIFIPGDRVGNAIKSGLIGGTISVVSGGKFANGAITAVFSRLLNDDAYTKRRKSTIGYDLKDGFEGFVDSFDYKGEARHEIHVYHKGKEVGMFQDGKWFHKHGHKAEVPAGFGKENARILKGVDVFIMRRMGRVPKGRRFNKGKMTGYMKAIPGISFVVLSYQAFTAEGPGQFFETFGIGQVGEGSADVFAPGVDLILPK